jgi:hypothetical protein
MPEKERQRGTVTHYAWAGETVRNCHTLCLRRWDSITHYAWDGETERDFHTLCLGRRDREELSHTSPEIERKETVTHWEWVREPSRTRPDRERNSTERERKEFSHIRGEWGERDSKCHTLGHTVLKIVHIYCKPSLRATKSASIVHAIYAYI